MKTFFGRVPVLMVAFLLVLAFTGCDSQQNETEAVTEQPVQSESSLDESDGSAEQSAQNSEPNNDPAVSVAADGLSVEDEKVIALEHAGLSADDVVFVISEFDNDVFVPHYDIEFTAGGYEYDYEISAETGKIIEYDKEIDDNDKQAEVDTSGFIISESAKDIALKHAGLSENKISGYKCELDVDDLISHFEIEFIFEGYEYEYEINAKTGNIMFSSKEIDD